MPGGKFPKKESFTVFVYFLLYRKNLFLQNTYNFPNPWHLRLIKSLVVQYELWKFYSLKFCLIEIPIW